MRYLLLSASYYCLWTSFNWQLRQSPQVLRWTLTAISVLGLFHAVYGTLAHSGVVSWNLLEPAGYVHSHSAHGTFANRNHYAAFLTLCASATIAAMLGNRRHDRSSSRSLVRSALDFLNQPSWLFRVVLLTIVIGIVLSRSRMGNTSFAIAAGVFGLAWLLQTTTVKEFVRVGLIFTSIIVVDILIISDKFGLDVVVQRLESTQLDSSNRAQVREVNRELLARAPWTGTGLGSYFVLEQAELKRFEDWLYIYAHDDHTQLRLEAGLPGYVVLNLLVLCHLGMAARTLRSRRRVYRASSAATFMVVTAAAIHSTVEFNAYIPAWAALFVVILALTTAPPSRRRSRRPNKTIDYSEGVQRRVMPKPAFGTPG
nr:O-antigen ligase family protein [Oceanococcus sp. HetDA_MAG_MS8]